MADKLIPYYVVLAWLDEHSNTAHTHSSFVRAKDSFKALGIALAENGLKTNQCFSQAVVSMQDFLDFEGNE